MLPLLGRKSQYKTQQENQIRAELCVQMVNTIPLWSVCLLLYAKTHPPHTQKNPKKQKKPTKTETKTKKAPCKQFWFLSWAQNGHRSSRELATLPWVCPLGAFYMTTKGLQAGVSCRSTGCYPCSPLPEP